MRRAAADQAPLRVAYVLKKFPRLSETFILNEILGLQAAGVDVAVHSLRLPDEGRYHGDLCRLGSEVSYLPPFSQQSAYEAMRTLAGASEIADRESFLALAELLPERGRADLVVKALHLAQSVRRQRIQHLHAHFMTVAARLACLTHFATGVPFSVTAHAKDIFRDGVDTDIFRAVAAAASHIVTVTDYNLRFIAERYLDGDATKLSRIYNSIPLPEADLRPLAERQPLVLGVGRLVEKKGFHVLMEACRLLADSGTSVPVEIIGEGEERERLEEIRARLGLEHLVSITGARPREVIFERMQQARVLAAPCVVGQDGNQDALPTVIIEALAAGLPPIASHMSGIPEMIDHGRDGWLVGAGDASALADGIRRLLQDDTLWTRMSTAGRMKVAARFDRHKTLPQLLEVFMDASQEVCSSHSALSVAVQA